MKSSGAIGGSKRRLSRDTFFTALFFFQRRGAGESEERCGDCIVQDMFSISTASSLLLSIWKS